MSEHTETRRKLMKIAGKREFRAIVRRCALSGEDRAILEMIYIKRMNLALIGDTLGMSESCVKKRHRNALEKIKAVL